VKRHRPPAAAPPPPTVDSRAPLWIVIAIGLGVLAAHVAGAYSARSVLWGAHSYAFLPPLVLPLAAGLLIVAVAGGLWLLRGAPPAPVTRLGTPHARMRSWLLRAAAAAGALVVFWGARSRQILLGDGIPLTANLPFETALHAREPLTSLVHQQTYRLLHVAGPGRDVHEIARDSVALGSVLAGALFVLAALALAAELLRLRPAPDGDLPAPHLAAALALLLAAQGFVLLFFGYIENYAFQALAMTVYVWLSLRYLRGAAPLLAPAAALLAAIAFNLSAVTLGVSFALLAGIGLASRERRGGALRDIAIAGALFAGLVFALHLWGGQYRFDRELLTMLSKGGGQTAYLLSRVHARDFLNEQLLIGPLALFWLLPALVLVMRPAGLRRPAVLFLAVGGVVQAIACWVVADLPLGYARDWDLFAPFAIVMIAGAAGLVLTRLRERRAVQRLLLVAVAVSLFHTVPWISLNTSAERSLERFKHLPLGKGRTESTVGFWYFAEGRMDEAREWLDRALVADPDNVRAYAHLGNIEMTEGRFEAAEGRFAEAVARRPNQPMFRFSLVTALIAQGREGDALGQLGVLVEQDPRRARYWAMAGVLLLGMHRLPEAHEAMHQALVLSPGDPLFTAAQARIDEPDGYADLLANEWPGIIGH
jgi:tetratricopeptide (TPR) repeat protein